MTDTHDPANDDRDADDGVGTNDRDGTDDTPSDLDGSDVEASLPDGPESPLQITRRKTLLGIGGLGTLGLGLEGASVATPADDLQSTALVQTSQSVGSTSTIGRGANAVHEGAFVIGDSTPREITSRAPDEVRSQIPMYAPSFNTTSARAAKTDVEPIDPTAILDGVESLSISTWRLKEADDGRHLGPMAGEFQDAFDLGVTDGTIATVDADGVALAAIEGFARRLDARNRRLWAELERLGEYVEELESRLDAVTNELDDGGGDEAVSADHGPEFGSE